MVGQIVNALVPNIQTAEIARIRGKRPDKLTAYELVLMARHRLNQLDLLGFQEAKELLTRAIESDPGYAESFALLADWHGLQISQGMSDNREHDQSMADAFGRNALARDPNNIRALTRYGHRKALLGQDFASALEIFEKALGIAPHSANSWMWSSHTFAYMGDAREAVRRAQYAMSLSPCDIDAHYDDRLEQEVVAIHRFGR
jgi:adenylate cyclase